MKHIKTIVAASIIAIVVNASFAESVTTPLPQDWVAGGALGKHMLTSFEQQERLSSITAAFGQVNTGKEKDEVFTITAQASAKLNDVGVLTRIVDVRDMQNQSFSLAFFFKQEGDIANKDVWIRFFDAHGQLSLLQMNLPLSYDDKNAQEDWLNVAQSVRIPSQAQRMEIGIGMRGQGRLQVRNFTIRPLPVNYGEHEKVSLAYAAGQSRVASKLKLSDIKLEP